MDRSRLQKHRGFASLPVISKGTLRTPPAFVQTYIDRRHLDFMILLLLNVLEFKLEKIFDRLENSMENKHVSSKMNMFSAL